MGSELHANGCEEAAQSEMRPPTRRRPSCSTSFRGNLLPHSSNFFCRSVPSRSITMKRYLEGEENPSLQNTGSEPERHSHRTQGQLKAGRCLEGQRDNKPVHMLIHQLCSLISCVPSSAVCSLISCVPSSAACSLSCVFSSAVCSLISCVLSAVCSLISCVLSSAACSLSCVFPHQLCVPSSAACSLSCVFSHQLCSLISCVFPHQLRVPSSAVCSLISCVFSHQLCVLSAVCSLISCVASSAVCSLVSCVFPRQLCVPSVPLPGRHDTNSRTLI